MHNAHYLLRLDLEKKNIYCFTFLAQLSCYWLLPNQNAFHLVNDLKENKNKIDRILEEVY